MNNIFFIILIAIIFKEVNLEIIVLTATVLPLFYGKQRYNNFPESANLELQFSAGPESN